MRRHTLPAPLLPVAVLPSACGGATSANSGGRTGGTGSPTLHAGDQKGGYEAILRASGDLDALGVTPGPSAGEVIVVPGNSPLKKPVRLKGASVAVAQGSSARSSWAAHSRRSASGSPT